MSELTAVDVSVRIMADGLDPAMVTGKLGITPTWACRKGDVEFTSQGNKVTRRTGVWIYASDLPATARFEDYFEALLGLFEPNAHAIRELKNDGYTVEFYCGLFFSRWNQGTKVSAPTLGRIAALGADLTLDVYDVSEEGSLQS